MAVEPVTQDTSSRSWTRAGQPSRLGNFTYPKYASKPPPSKTQRYPVVVVGGGMVGLTIAVDLARKGLNCVLIDDNDTVSAGSRSIAQTRRTMDIWSRLGCAEPMSRNGISWNKGHTHYGDNCVLSFEIFPEGGTRFPSITSLAQYYVEHFLVQRALDFPNLDLRWLHRLCGVTPLSDGKGVSLDVETPDGRYTLEADWVVGADGSRSETRRLLGLDFPGDRIRDKFVIADVRMDTDLPFERNYWFNPPFYNGNSVLRVPQSDSIWRIDWQIDPDADADVELDRETVKTKLAAIFGGNADFTPQWVGTYTSEHRLMDSFRHGRVLFVGDAAHQFSPFGGGRGGNSGVQDADNLAWKLAAVINGKAPERLLDSFNEERRPIALGNLADSKKSTEFITPKSRHSRALRNTVLRLATVTGFAKAFVNTGRFAVWPVLENSPLSATDPDFNDPTGRPGTPVLDCSLTDQAGAQRWLAAELGDDFVLVTYEAATDAPLNSAAFLARANEIFPFHIVRIAAAQAKETSQALIDATGAFAHTYAAQPGTAYLFRPDQHVAARWRNASENQILSAMRRSLGLAEGE